MKRLLFHGAALSGVTLLLACAAPTSTIVSSVSHSRLESLPGRVFVLSYLGQEVPDPYEDGYIETIVNGFTKEGWQTSVVKLTGLEIDRNAHRSQQAAFQPDLVMHIRFNASDTYGSHHRGEALLTLLVAAGESEAWQLRQKFSFGYDPMFKAAASSAGSSAASEAFRRLLDDGVFSRLQTVRAAARRPE